MELSVQGKLLWHASFRSRRCQVMQDEADMCGREWSLKGKRASPPPLSDRVGNSCTLTYGDKTYHFRRAWCQCFWIVLQQP
jgi:hypothetical protein